jgi:hypothetical protein
MCCEWHALTLVVVNDLYVVGVALPEYKANTPTCVHGHRPLAFAVSLELVQSDAFKWTQVLQGAGDVQCRQQIQRSGKIQAAKLAWAFRPPTPYGRRRCVTIGSRQKRTTGSGQPQQLFRRHPVCDSKRRTPGPPPFSSMNSTPAFVTLPSLRPDKAVRGDRPGSSSR